MLFDSRKLKHKHESHSKIKTNFEEIQAVIIVYFALL